MEQSAAPAETAVNSSDNTSRWLSGAALVVALIALGLVGAAVARGHRRSAASARPATESGTA